MSKKIIISGGGTGGHVFPAIAIADALKQKLPGSEFLFVGATGRMEMDRVPAAGYKIIGLPVSGLKRKLSLENIKVFMNLLKSMRMAKKIIRDFRPDIVIGVGGYASYPVMKSAARQGIPILIQEQNSFAGVANKMLAKKASRICVAYDKMDRFFPAERITLTGNPVREDVVKTEGKKTEALSFYGLEAGKKTIFIMGGSLGARTINESILQHLDELKNSGLQVLWQTGKLYYKDIMEKLKNEKMTGITVLDFISRMDYAYAISDLIVSRAGAISISELCLVGKPVILVPSPNVAEDHQTKNALSLVSKDAAMMVRDGESKEKLVQSILSLINNQATMEQFQTNIKKLAKPGSAGKIADEAINIML